MISHDDLFHEIKLHRFWAKILEKRVQSIINILIITISLLHDEDYSNIHFFLLRDKEFSVPLYDETERNVMKPLGELNFWITLGEVEDMRVPGDRRRSMIKQLKEDREVENRLTPLLIRSPSEMSQVSRLCFFTSIPVFISSIDWK